MENKTSPQIADNKITFKTVNGQVSMNFSGPVALTDFFQVVFTGMLGQMKQVVASVPEEQRQEAIEDIYDMFNAAASNTLHYFAPEVDMRPHLTTQAILEAENAIIEKMSRDQKKANLQKVK